MNVCSLPFLALVAALTLLTGLVPARFARLASLTLANVAFLVLAIPNKKSALALAVWVLGTYAMLRLARGRLARWLVPGFAVLVVAAFLYLKRYTFLELVLPASAWPFLIEVLGISYTLFKFLHMLVDQSQGQLAPYNLASYANYQLSLFTLVAGPIQRYNDFHAFWTAEVPDLPDHRDSLLTWNRLLGGMIQVGVLAPLALSVFDDARAHLPDASNGDAPGWFAIVFYSYPVFMYLNFSGYTDIVVASARLIGLTLPENFNRPYLARNVIDYWNRWHISLTHWIRDYVFMTSYKKAMERAPMAWSKGIGYGLLFLSLFLSGVWHGSTAAYAIFGAIHGFGVASCQWYTDWLRKRLGRERFKAYQANPRIQILARLVTIHFVGFAFIFFGLGTGPSLNAFRTLGRWFASGTGHLGTPSAVGLGMFLLVVLLVLATNPIGRFLNQVRNGFTASDRPLFGVVLARAVVIAVVLVVLWGLEREPEVAYMRF